MCCCLKRVTVTTRDSINYITYNSETNKLQCNMSRLNDNPDYRQGNAASAGSGDDVMVTSGFKSSVTAKGWRKVLYDSPDSRLGDNYTPHQYFLDAIERNKNLHKYSLSECLVGSCQARV